MSTREVPKQLIPFIGGRSLLQIAMERLDGFLPADRVYVCAGASHKRIMLERLVGLDESRFIAEPQGRDTLNAVGLGSAVLAKRDPDATVAIFTADHLIEPVAKFQQIVERGFELAESRADTLVTFGIAPTHAATGYGYLQLGESIGEHGCVVDQFKEKPPLDVAEQYVAAGPGRYLWNSGMFVWRARTMMDCIAKYAPDNHAGLVRVAEAWDTAQRDAVLAAVYPTLKKISVDFAVMEPASQDADVTVAAVPMDLTWLDVGSWPAYGQTLTADEHGCAVSGCRHVLHESKNVLVVSDEPEHLVTTIGVEDVIVVHTAKATLVCRAQDAEKIKQLHAAVGERHGEAWL